MQLSGQRVLLTGATGGIGRAIARALAAKGSTLIVSGRKAEALEQLIAELPGSGHEAIAADLASADDVRRLVADAGRVDIFVANAGLPASGPIPGFSPEELDRAVDVNLRSPIHMAHALIPGMVERGSGHFVFISSISGKIASPGSGLYSATKFGLRGFSFGLRQDLFGTGVSSSTVFPGFISDAGMWADTGLDAPPGTGTRTPDQVADAVIKAIEKDKGEIDVAPIQVRFGAWVSGPAPGVVAGIQKRSGGKQITDLIAEKQADKR